jgi:hypothetical protein
MERGQQVLRTYKSVDAGADTASAAQSARRVRSLAQELAFAISARHVAAPSGTRTGQENAMTITGRRLPGIFTAAIVFASSSWTLTAGRAQDAAGDDVKATAAQEQAGRIHIAYEAPKNPEHQKIYELSKERHALETLQQIFSPFRLSVDMTIKTVGCDGVSNAWYQRVANQPTVSLCYEYLQEIWQSMPKETTQAGITPGDAMVGQFFFAATHEIGHAMFDIFDVPIFGRQEDAADQFAAYVMLQFGGDRAHRLVTGAAYSYRAYIKDYKQKPSVTLPLAAFSSDHGSPEERFYNLLCMAYGYDAKVFADLVDQEYLPKTRAKKCLFEYKDIEYAFQQVFTPHIDREMAKKVLETKRLPDAITRPVAR